jgi:hypothetical protein
MTRTIEELPEDIRSVVIAYAAKHGRQWKAKLANDWGTGRDTSFPDGWALRDIRNNPAWGHKWLAAVVL